MVRETLVSKYLLPSVLNIVFLDMKQENKYLLVQRESLFERFFIGSPTTQISNKISVPLLIFHS